MSKRKGPTKPRVNRWGPWFESDHSPLPDGSLVFGNGYWTVHITSTEEEVDRRNMSGGLHLSIHDRPRSTRHDWRDFQRIKDELVGPEREAVELYPAASRLLDTANEYHLWVLPVGERYGLGMDFGRPITEESLKDAPPEEVEAVRAQLGIAPDAPDRSRQRRRAS